MRRIALFGGTFDPVHLGHLHAAECVADALVLDRVIFIPANIPPHKKNGSYVNGSHRLNMLRLATSCDRRFEVSDFELQKEETSYSYITAEHFAKQYPDDKLYFIIGDEAYALLHTWKTPERIRAVAEFAVVTREGTTPPQDALYVKIPKVEISSTEVRRHISSGLLPTALLPESVITYIKENGLYQMGENDDRKRNA